MAFQPTQPSSPAQSECKIADPEQRSYRFSWFDWFCLWYPPGWLILFNRHWQHYHDDPQGWTWLEYLLFLIPCGFYLALLIRWLRLGCRAPQQIERVIDPTYQRAFRQEILLPIVERYFRAELHQIENLPQSGPLIVAINHAGMCFPWDMVSLGVLLSQVQGWVVQPVAHPIFFDHPWLKWWLPTGWSQVLGGVHAALEDFEATVRAQTPQTALLYAPEGWRGLAKGWQHRYQLETFDPSFIRLSDRYQVPIAPVVCLGNESLHPWSVNLKSLARRFGMPMFPLSILMPMFLLFPSMGVWANRTRLRYYAMPPERVWETTPSPNQNPDQNQSRAAAYQTAQQLRSRFQSFIDQCIASGRS